VRSPSLITACLFFCVTHAVASALERRCGWLDNPSPANWWLVDKDGTWILMEQGGDRTSWF
jgi:hypothetical protein